MRKSTDKKTATFYEQHGTLYIKTSDGRIGVVTGETRCFVDSCCEFSHSDGTPFTLSLRFSKRTRRQVGTPNRTFEPLQYKDA